MNHSGAGFSNHILNRGLQMSVTAFRTFNHKASKFFFLSVFLLLLTSTVMTASNAEAVWTQRATGISTTARMNSVAWSGAQFVVVGGYELNQGATILTSPGGIIWTKRFLPLEGDLQTVAWNGSIFVTMGTPNIPPGVYGPYDTPTFVATSPDGVNWATQTLGADYSPRSLIWAGSQFICLSGSGGILTSPDGATWTHQTSATDNLSAITWSGTQFVAVGASTASYQSLILTSPDGVNWTTRTSVPTYNLLDVVWNGSQFIAVGGKCTIVTSPDGITWTPQAAGCNPDRELGAIAWNGAQFAAVGFDDFKNMDAIIVTSPDGVNWTEKASGVIDYITDVTWGAGRFVAVTAHSRYILTEETARLSVSVTGNGSVTSDVAGSAGAATMNCLSSTTCLEDYDPVLSTLVSLTATPTAGFVFEGWGGDCITSGIAPTCAVTMNAAKSVTALFSASQTPAVITSPTPGSTLAGSSQAFTWSVTSGASGYYVWVGSSQGTANLGSSGTVLSVTSLTVTGLPTDGRTIWVRIHTLLNGTWYFNDYSYTAASIYGEMLTPTPGSTLAGSSQTFTWSAASGASGYYVWVGSSQGTANLGSSGTVLSVTSLTVTGLPTDGRTIWVRILTLFNGTWYFNDYSYTAASIYGEMLTPTPGSTLAGSSQNIYMERRLWGVRVLRLGWLLPGNG